MSYQNYDFVGVSTKPLPYVHDSFPAGQKLGTVKYCTMRSMHRGKDANRKNAVQMKSGQGIGGEIRELLDIKLPKLDLKPQKSFASTNCMNPRLHYGNINKQKAYCRLRGIHMGKMYTLNRAKTERRDYDEPESNLDPDSHNRSVSLTFLDMKQPESKTARESSTEEREYSFIETSESPWSRVRLRELDDESPIPGFKSRKIKNGRRLGNVVSSRRLQQLLDNEDTLDPYAFYMY